ncbi:prolyl oligopeptidase family serine peptidase [Rothia sp. LK2588]|uniref:prolyl oligopeptidase family serine peptidase n=1 Tax=Rothia sp. LK2588 TaxID=3114369 RepID=UPI0034CFD63E
MTSFLHEIQRFSRLPAFGVPVPCAEGFLHIFRPEGASAAQVWQAREEQLLAGNPGRRLQAFEAHGTPQSILSGGSTTVVLVRTPGSERLTAVDHTGAVLQEGISPLAPAAVSSQGQLLVPAEEAEQAGVRWRLAEMELLEAELPEAEPSGAESSGEQAVPGEPSARRVVLVQLSATDTRVYPALPDVTLPGATLQDTTVQVRAASGPPLCSVPAPGRIFFTGGRCLSYAEGALTDLRGARWVLPAHEALLSVSALPVPDRLVAVVQVRGRTELHSLTPAGPSLLTRLDFGQGLAQMGVCGERIWLAVRDARAGQTLCWLSAEAPGEAPLQTVPTAGPAAQIAYRTLYARADDGVRVPYVCAEPPASSHVEERAPLLLTVYGAFGVPHLPSAEPTLPAWVGRGASMVFAQVRGGGELGPQWHEAGAGEQKFRAVADALAVIEDLRERFPRRPVVLCGASMGGLVALVAAIEAAERGVPVAAVAATAPVLDAVHLDRHPNGRFWREEFPAAATDRARVSPLHRVAARSGPLPPLWLAWAGRDERVADDAPAFAAEWERRGSVRTWCDEDLAHVGNPVERIDRRSADLLDFAWAQGFSEGA